MTTPQELARLISETRQSKKAAPTQEALAPGFTGLTEEPVVGLSSNGRAIIGGRANGGILRTVGNGLLTVGELAVVLWKSGLPVAVIKGAVRKSQPVGGRRGANGLEELFLVANNVTGRNDVYYRNADFSGVLVEGASVSANPQTVNWGANDNEFVVRLQGYVYRIYRLSRPIGTIPSGPVTSQFVREDTLPTTLEIFRLSQTHSGSGLQRYWTVPCAHDGPGIGGHILGGPAAASVASDSYNRLRTDVFKMTPLLFTLGVGVIQTETLDVNTNLIVSFVLPLGTDASLVGGTTSVSGSDTTRVLGVVGNLANVGGIGVFTVTSAVPGINSDIDGFSPGEARANVPVIGMTYSSNVNSSSIVPPTQFHAFVVDVTHGLLLWSSAVSSPSYSTTNDTGRLGIGATTFYPGSPVFNNMPNEPNSTPGGNWLETDLALPPGIEFAGAVSAEITSGVLTVASSLFNRTLLPMLGNDDESPLVTTAGQPYRSGRPTSIGLTTPGAYCTYTSTVTSTGMIPRWHRVLECRLLVASTTLAEMRLLLVIQQEKWIVGPSGGPDGKGVGIWIINGLGQMISTVLDWTRTYDLITVLTATDDLVVWAARVRATGASVVLLWQASGTVNVAGVLAEILTRIYRSVDLVSQPDSLYETRETTPSQEGLRFIDITSLPSTEQEDASLASLKDLVELGVLVPITATRFVTGLSGSLTIIERVGALHAVE